MSTTAGLDQLAELIADRLGLSAQNLRREKLQEALHRLAASKGEASVMADLQQLDFRSDPWQTMIAAATIPETRFLRQPGWFRQIEILALAPLIKRRRQRGDRRLRIWSAGCATGEEPYTLAMLVRDLIPDLDEWRVEILATDINAEAMRGAERGIYATRQLRDLDPVQIARHFEASAANRYTVRPALRDMVRFQPANLTADASQAAIVGPFDLILCRNVLIYLTPEMQRRVGAHLCAAVSHEGWLAVAPAEAITDWFRPLVPVNAPEAILFRKQTAKDRREAPPSFNPPLEIRLDHRPAPSRAPVATAVLPPLSAPPAPVSLDDVRNLADRGALDEARMRCGELLGQDALNGDACLLLSAICSELGDFATAHDAARRAIYLTPASAEAHFQLAGVLRSLGHSARAEKTMETASRLAMERLATTPALTGTQIGAGDDGKR